MASAIDAIGKINRPVNPDLFGELIHAIIAQQISSKAADTVWRRLHELTPITPKDIADLHPDVLQAIGISYRKVGYIQGVAYHIMQANLDLNDLHQLSDDEVIKVLSSFNGVGEWTAQMLLIFSMNRMNVLSWHDLAIIRGLRMLYRHRHITPALFAKYQRRFAPYNSVASLYLWAIAGGAMDLTNPKR